MTGARVYASAGDGTDWVSVDMTTVTGAGVITIGAQHMAGTDEQLKALYLLLDGIYGA